MKNHLMFGLVLKFVLVCEMVVGAAEQSTGKISISSSSNFFDGGTVHIISSSHQDIAWMDSPQYCRSWREINNTAPCLEIMRNNKEYRFTVETMMYLMDELEDHPERQEKIHTLTKIGQLEWGATYNQPYESMLSGEQLVREVYLGRKWLHKTFRDCDAVVAWNPDVPGRAMQMPQILSKAGIPYLVFSRHQKGLFDWKSPDGSGITAYSPGHYYEDSQILSKKREDAILQLRKRLYAEQQYYKAHNIEPQYALLNSQDFSKPVDFGGLINTFNNEKGDSVVPPCQIKYSPARDYFEQVTKGHPKFESIRGERPNVWLYIHGPTHQKALSASRKAGILLPAAETFATITRKILISQRNVGQWLYCKELS
jgi:alpha-mannosidase